MGWKTVKERYQIGHIVHMREGKLCVGSPYCTALIEISPTGSILKPYESYGTNADLIRYMKEFIADPQALADAIAAEDAFERSLPVYTYDEEKGVVEKFCEERGWPSITHDGELMYENAFFETREEAIIYGIKNEEACIRFARKQMDDLMERYRGLIRSRREAKERLEKLHSLPPS